MMTAGTSLPLINYCSRHSLPFCFICVGVCKIDVCYGNQQQPEPATDTQKMANYIKTYLVANSTNLKMQAGRHRCSCDDCLTDFGHHKNSWKFLLKNTCLWCDKNGWK